MKQLEIKPTQGGEIIFGKLPLLPWNTRKALGVANDRPIVQFKMEGRYYAVELQRTTVLSDSDIDKLTQRVKGGTEQSFVSYTTKDVEEKVDKPEQPEPTVKPSDLTDLGFVNLSNASSTTKTHSAQQKYGVRTKGKLGVDVDSFGRPLKQGNLSLIDWLKSQDYVIYKMFIYGDGQVSMSKSVTHKDIEEMFVKAGVPEKSFRAEDMGTNASRLAAVAITQLMRAKVFMKETRRNGENVYSLTVDKGGTYARGVYRTVQAHAYSWSKKKGYRVFYNEKD